MFSGTFIGSLLIILGVTGFVWPLTPDRKDGQSIDAIEIAVAITGMAVTFAGLILKSK
jgi:hypothetical protein